MKTPQALKKLAVFSTLLFLITCGPAALRAQDNGASQGVFLKAVGAFNAGNYPSAQDDFLAVLKGDPDNLKAHFYLGLIKYELNLLPEASAYFQWVVDRDPRNPVVFYYLGRAAYDQEKWDYAAEELMAADKLDPGISMVHYYLGLSYYKLKKTEVSKEQFLQALKLEPSLSKAHYALAYLYFHDLKDSPSAILEIKAGLKAKPDAKLKAKFLRLKKQCG